MDAQTIQVWMQGGFFSILLLVLVKGIPWLVKEFKDSHAACDAHVIKIIDDRSKTSDAVDKLCDATIAGFSNVKLELIEHARDGRHNVRNVVQAVAFGKALPDPDKPPEGK